MIAPDHTGYLHVAAAVIFDHHGRVLVAKRPNHLHQGGLWEFPGGKLEQGEQAAAALRRELREELAIEVREARPLIRVPHAYPDRKVLLDVWRVDAFDGEAYGREGQEVRWLDPDSLPDLQFPAANKPIVSACRLPDRYLITPEPGLRSAWGCFLERLEKALCGGIRLVQLRAKSVPVEELIDLGQEVRDLTRRHGARLLVNSASPSISADGIHLTASDLRAATRRPDAGLVAASCHSLEEVMIAQRIGCDFVVLSPVNQTMSHPDTEPLGWHKFRVLTEYSAIPVFALGGVGLGELELAWRNGAQGIAAISALWPQ